MSLDKAINYEKEHRQEYRPGKTIDLCANIMVNARGADNPASTRLT